MQDIDGQAILPKMRKIRGMTYYKRWRIISCSYFISILVFWKNYLHFNIMSLCPPFWGIYIDFVLSVRRSQKFALANPPTYYIVSTVWSVHFEEVIVLLEYFIKLKFVRTWFQVLKHTELLSASTVGR